MGLLKKQEEKVDVDRTKAKAASSSRLSFPPCFSFPYQSMRKKIFPIFKVIFPEQFPHFIFLQSYLYLPIRKRSFRRKKSFLFFIEILEPNIPLKFLQILFAPKILSTNFQTNNFPKNEARVEYWRKSNFSNIFHPQKNLHKVHIDFDKIKYIDLHGL